MLLTDFIKSVFLLESSPKLKDDVLPETGVVAGTYGEIAEIPPEDETQETERVLKVPNITVDDKGRITNVALSDVSLNEIVTVSDDQLIIGSKTFTSGLSVNAGDNGVTASVDNSYLELTGATSSSNGAWLDLHGKDDSSNGGSFRLGANNGTNTVRLVGSANGELTWNGNPVVTNYNGYTFSGAVYAETPSELTDDSNQIATTEWVQDVVDDKLTEAMRSIIDAMGDDASGDGPVVPNKGHREVWVVEEAIAAGTDVTLPNDMAYVVGDNRLFAVVNGAMLMPGLNYVEIGNDGDVSTTIQFNMPLNVGDEVMVYMVPIRVIVIDSSSGSQNTDPTEPDNTEPSEPENP